MAANRSVAVYGTGAVGGYLAARLARGNPDLAITLLGRQSFVEAVRRQGLVVREGKSEQVVRLPAVTSAADLPPCDLVLLSVRTDDVAASIDQVRRLIGERGLVLAMQNGVGSEEALASALGRQRVLAGTLTVAVGMEQPGGIVRWSRQGGVALSSMDGAPVPGWIVGAFRATDLPTELVADYRSLRWSKLLLNMLGAPISAILDIDMAQLVANPSLFRLDQLAFREATRVIDAQGIQTVALPGYPIPLARLAMRFPRALAQPLLGPRLAGARAGHSPGMRAQLARGRSDVRYLNGAVVEAGRRYGIPTPVNAVLTELVEELAQHPERREEFRGKPEVLLRRVRDRQASSSRGGS